MSRVMILALAGLGVLGCRGSVERADPTATPEPPPKTPDVRITTDAILLGDQQLFALSGDRALGVPAEQKRNGANDLYIVRLHDGLKQAQDEGRLARQTPERKAELVVMVDPATTYRVLFEVLYTAGQTELGRYQLHEGERGGRTIATEPPARFTPPTLDSTGRLVGPMGLNLSVLVVADGAAMKTSSGNIAPGCNDIGKGLAVPKIASGHDVAGLAECAKKLKAAKPELASETAVTVTASPGTPFREVMDVVFALRGSDTEPLFPTVHFGVAR